jgi:hypothetical protein
MDWAKKRQALVLAIFAAVGIALVTVISIAIFYKTPTCTDGKQNQGETGLDCGGPCARACVVDVRPAQVRFARAVASAPGRTDVIAYVDNPNQDAAAHAVRANVEAYDANHTLLAKREVMFDLPSGGTVPVYVEGLVSSSTSAVTQTFFTLDPASITWIRVSGKPIVPAVQNIQWQGGSMPRVSATLSNPLAQAASNITLIAVVFDSSGQAIAASRTFVSTLPPQGTAPLIFTWSIPFTSAPARVDVVPIIPVRAL